MSSGENNSKKIAIFVSHRIDLKSMVIDNPLYVPVRCGAALDENDEGNVIMGDNTGDNISEKRISFCEYTVQYWAWKNYDADYYGSLIGPSVNFVNNLGMALISTVGSVLYLFVRLWIPLCRAMTTMYEWKTTFRYAPQSYISFSISQRWRRRSHPMTLLSARLSIRQRSPEYVPETV